jgi:hypothetical protein
VVQANVEESTGAVQNNPKRICRALGDGAALGEQCFLLRFALCLARLALRLRQEQVAILEALKRIKERVLGLELGLHLLGLAEARLCLGPAARLV